MFPLHDDNPTEIFPLFTLGIIGLCVLAWVELQGAGLSSAELSWSVCAFGAIPAEVTGRVAPFAAGPCELGGLRAGALLTSMFMHGGWLHLLGNLWFLWIFGNNIEDSMGRLRFALFYLLTGLAAGLAQVAVDPASTVPLVGASGAVSGIMGAYLVLYPRARVHTLFWFIFFVRVWPLPAWFLLLYWLFLQLVGLGAAATGGGGVAYAAHLGGFLAGIGLVPLFANRKLVGAKRARVVLDRRELDRGGWW